MFGGLLSLFRDHGVQIKLGILYNETMEVTSKKKKRKKKRKNSAFPLPSTAVLDFLGRPQKSHGISRSFCVSLLGIGVAGLCVSGGAKLCMGSEGNNP